MIIQFQIYTISDICGNPDIMLDFAECKMIQ